MKLQLRLMTQIQDVWNKLQTWHGPVTHHLSEATANPETMGKIRELAICVQLMLVKLILSKYLWFCAKMSQATSACSHVLPWHTSTVCLGRGVSSQRASSERGTGSGHEKKPKRPKNARRQRLRIPRNEYLLFWGYWCDIRGFWWLWSSCDPVFARW